MRRTAVVLAVLLIGLLAESCLTDSRNRNSRAVDEQDYVPMPDTAGLRSPSRKQSDPETDKTQQDTLLPAIALEGQP